MHVGRLSHLSQFSSIFFCEDVQLFFNQKSASCDENKIFPLFFYLFLFFMIHSKQECLKGEYKCHGEAPDYRQCWGCLLIYT